MGAEGLQDGDRTWGGERAECQSPDRICEVSDLGMGMGRTGNLWMVDTPKVGGRVCGRAGRRMLQLLQGEAQKQNDPEACLI